MAASSERLLWVLCWACVFSQQLREIKKCSELRFKPRTIPFLTISSDHCPVALPYPWLLSLWNEFQLLCRSDIEWQGGGTRYLLLRALCVLYVGALHIGQFAIKNQLLFLFFCLVTWPNKLLSGPWVKGGNIRAKLSTDCFYFFVLYFSKWWS